MGYGRGYGRGFGHGYGRGRGGAKAISGYTCLKFVFFAFNVLFWVSSSGFVFEVLLGAAVIVVDV